MTGVDHRVDIEDLPFTDCTYDLVYASHVLEHIKNDMAAIREIRRVLKPAGFAVLPVPLVSDKTVEYPEPNQHESFHVRAPGLDYFDRFSSVFSRVETYSSDMFSDQFQLFVYEDRTKWPSVECPLRPAMSGERHTDAVPVCFV